MFRTRCADSDCNLLPSPAVNRLCCTSLSCVCELLLYVYSLLCLSKLQEAEKRFDI